MFKRFIALGWIVVLLATFAASAQATTLRGFHFEVGAKAERISILSDGALKQKHLFMLENPSRLVVDFAAFNVGKIGLPETYNGNLINGIRSGSFDASTTRMVFDLKTPVKILARYHVAPDGSLWRYVIDIAPKSSTVMHAAPSPPVATKPTKKIIAVDAGHGGQDPGARGKLLREKDVTLRYATALAERLNKTGRYQAFLVRKGDSFIALHDRVKIARGKKADVFISLHADSNPSAKAQGLSLYTLSETASDDEAEALAARENKSDVIDGIDLGVADADVADILIELAQRETMNKSAALADAIVKAMPRGVRLLPRTHRYAGFRVLKGTDMPSVLIELGFLSNRSDEQNLASQGYKDLVMQGVVSGIDRFFAAKK